VLRRMFAPKRDEVKGQWRKLNIGVLNNCTHNQISAGRSNQGELCGWGMWQAWERGETCTGFWWESPKEIYHLKDQGVDGRMGLDWILGRFGGGGVWSRFTWLRVGTVGGMS
jgi:hypothetical protein